MMTLFGSRLSPNSRQLFITKPTFFLRFPADFVRLDIDWCEQPILQIFPPAWGISELQWHRNERTELWTAVRLLIWIVILWSRNVEQLIDVLKGLPSFYEGFFIPTLITNAEEQDWWPFQMNSSIMLSTSLYHVILWNPRRCPGRPGTFRHMGRTRPDRGTKEKEEVGLSFLSSPGTFNFIFVIPSSPYKFKIQNVFEHQDAFYCFTLRYVAFLALQPIPSFRNTHHKIIVPYYFRLRLLKTGCH